MTSDKPQAVASNALFGVWIPIESAPQNGTQILVRCSGDRMAAVRWLDGMFIGTGWFAVVPFNGGWGHGSDTFIQFKEDQPTHWMPLPNPPNPAVRGRESASVPCTGVVGSLNQEEPKS